MPVAREDFVRIGCTSHPRVSDGNVIIISSSEGRHHRHARHHFSIDSSCHFWHPGPHAAGGGKAVIVFEIIAAALAIAGITYLLLALLKPERF
ncbi:hypothetical protein CQ018_06990 [Arthrobacter sp. MYb227]|nr:hypothetical protein CQ018_06990 [Arthrobacter sp. MYb227]